MNSKASDLVIVGGGAAGLMAGVSAVRAGMKTLIIERLGSVGKKLLATGGGRCNLTRDLPIGELLDGYYGKKNFVRTAIYDFQPAEMIKFFTSLGLECVVEAGGRVFPKSSKASDVLGVLKKEYARLGGELLLGEGVSSILCDDRVCRGVVVDGCEYLAGSVLLSAGGCSMAELGSDGSGFALARELGHKVVQPSPALVGLVVADLPHDKLAGVSLPACSVKVGSGKAAHVFQGDLLFTHKGLSGTVVLDASGIVGRLLEQNKDVKLTISFCNDSKEDWENRFTFWRKSSGVRTISAILSEYFPKRFVKYILDSSNTDESTTLAELKKISQDKIIDFLVASVLEVSRTEGFKKSYVTAGGVDTKEVFPKTLESRRVENLYFAGEVLDVDGRCGGYNLEWAFASARLVINSIGKK